MLSSLWTFSLLASSVLVFACDQTDEVQRRLCVLENEVRVLGNAMQEVLTRTDITLEEPKSESIEKRKNEFIRFGKRSAEPEDMEMEKRKNEFIRFGKRKNEFIRFGKRKNEFIRFGRSAPEMMDDGNMEKRKNEFIRFG
ncbi:unnamed protein product, partial [Mesorhabditis belari]|uniref:Uncharacterized protein n=1 Tax=Mesorhabditis belari TaxID=2138241 RepID=A0AAF3FHU8_9BILA